MKSNVASRLTIAFFKSVSLFWSFRDLIRQLVLRDVTGRYKGSYLGLLWSFLNPLFMLVIYTFVFSVVMKARWGLHEHEGHFEYAITLLCGLIPFNIFAESVSRAPGLVLAHANYVKRVVFPLEILPAVVLFSSLIQSAISLAIVVTFAWLFLGVVSWTIIFLPLAILPLLALSLGIGWFLAALGVFIRDIGHTVSIMTQALFFMTPILYPASAIPQQFRPVFELNPLSAIIEAVRCSLIWEKSPPWLWLGVVAALSFAVYLMGYYWFMRSKPAFADII